MAPEADDPESCERFLRALGASDSAVWPLAEAALALAVLAEKRAAPPRYRQELARLADNVGRHSGARGDLAARAVALSDVVLLKHGYSGDRETYDDLQNANLLRVIDRRKGLPVALGILFIHAGRAHGWELVGLAFPGHFLVRLAEGPDQLIVDPFHDGRVCGAAELRALLKAVAGGDSELLPAYYAAVSDREILLRLQNNLKSRLLQERQHDEAARIVETMLLFAPDAVELWHEAAMLYRELGKLRAAATALEHYVVRAPDGVHRHRAAALLQQVRRQLN